MENSLSLVSEEKSVPSLSELLTDQLKGLHALLTGLEAKPSRKELRQVRIALRRLRTYFFCFKPILCDSKLKLETLHPRKWQKNLKRMLQLFGKLRQRELVLKFLYDQRQNSLEISEKYKEKLYVQIVQNVEKRRIRLKKQISKNQILDQLQALITLLKTHSKLLPSLSRIRLKNESAERNFREEWSLFQKNPKLLLLHETRLAIKKWRYLSLLSEENKVDLQALKAAQDRLGKIHDLGDVLEILAWFRKQTASKTYKKHYKPFQKQLKAQLKSKMQLLAQDGIAL